MISSAMKGLGRHIRTFGLMATLAGCGVSSALAASDNPYDLIDPSTISVGTMGDAKPYAFVDANGQFSGFDIEFFLNVVSRMGFDKDHVAFTGQDFSALMPSVANGRFDVAVATIGTTERARRRSTFPTAISPAT